MWIYWLQMFDEYWYKKDTPHPDDFNLWPDWLFQYYNEIPLVEAIESSYITLKIEQQRLIPNYYIMNLFVTLVKHYNVTMVEDDNQFKMTCQKFNCFVTCSGSSG